MLSRFHRFGYCRVLAVWAASLLAVSLVGCQPPRDDYAEFLLEQRNKAIQQLERKAERDKTLDILCWDISSYMNKANTVKKWATSQKGLDVLALSGPNLNKLKQAADMAEVVNSLDRGWPAVTSSNERPRKEPGPADAVAEPAIEPDQYFVMNANGYRFDGVMADEIEGWQPTATGEGRADPPSILHLQVRYTQHEAILVYLTHCDAVSEDQWKSLSKWVDEQDVPVIVFGQFDASRLSSPSLVTIDPARLAVSKSIQSWQFNIEQLQSPLGDGAQPYMIHCLFSP